MLIAEKGVQLQPALFELGRMTHIEVSTLVIRNFLLTTSLKLTIELEIPIQNYLNC